MMDWNAGKAPGLDKLGKKRSSSGSRKTTRAAFTLAMAISSLFIVNLSGASAQTAAPTPVPSPTAVAPTPAASPTAATVPTAMPAPGTTTTTGNGPTTTSTEVRSPTSTSTQATTTGNVTVTGGAGNGDTTVNIFAKPDPAAALGSLGIACQYKLGFAALHGLIPAIAGDCLTDETHNVMNGDGLQSSSGGLLVWRKADNWTAFTDGSSTWINGPAGIQQRLNGERYSWEANPDNLPLPPA